MSLIRLKSLEKQEKNINRKRGKKAVIINT